VGTLLAVGLSVVGSGCSREDDSGPVLAPPLETALEAPNEYDPELEPARAVLPLVPADAGSLQVTDFDRVRLEQGVGDLTGESPAAERSAFWRRAEAESPLLSEGVVRPDEQALQQQYGLTQDDVSWEAHFTTESGEGWVMKLRDDVPTDALEQAVAEIAPGAEVDLENLLVLNGAASDADDSWAADESIASLVPEAPAQATYVSSACLDTEASGDTADLAELGPFSVSYGGTLATVRLGEDRTDVFARSRLTGGPAFAEALTDMVADPGTGRIGYRMADPALAADLAVSGRLPFAVCAS
jgi:hypothetical protein